MVKKVPIARVTHAKLVTTDGTGESYRSPISFWGAVVMISLATLLLIALDWIHRDRRMDKSIANGTSI